MMILKNVVSALVVHIWRRRVIVSGGTLGVLYFRVGVSVDYVSANCGAEGYRNAKVAGGTDSPRKGKKIGIA